MVPILAKQALARKCEFSNARMTGNYECAYALGVVSGALAIPKEENAANLVELKNKIEPQYKKLSSENEQIKKLILLLCDYEPSDIFDEQMRELYNEGYEDKSIEAFLKPTAVGAVFGADSTKVGRNPVITSRTPSTDKLEEFLQAEKEAGHFDGSSDYPPKSDIFPAILIQVLPLVLLVALWIFFMRRMSGGGSGGPGGVFNVGKSKAQLFEKG